MSDSTSPLLNSSSDSPPPPNQLQPIRKLSQNLALLSASSLFLTPAIMILKAGGYSSLGPFVFHPLFQSIAISVIAVSILSLQPTKSGNTKLRAFNKHRKLISYLSLPSFVLGSSAMYYNKYLHSAPHFTSWHSTFGLVTLALLVVQISVGLAFAIPSTESPILPKRLYKVHRLSGYFVLLPLLALTAALGGGHSTWSTTQAPLIVRVLFIDVPAATLVLAIWTGIQKHKLGF
ncbi:hypothetical protein E3P99_03757 [Wallemia hederae]|uniref:Cytochrome b561 domain-containing protein n=1 Tax=Wallemia hederae TaxID=1540922 RepID=A0A4T0FFU2_9BASI|nr:hypothetical protein E3P99_03757 [Wallemia hederae]